VEPGRRGLSVPESSTRELIAFDGPVHCEAARGAVNLVLSGTARVAPGSQLPHGGLTQVLFSGASAVALPAGLHDATVIEIAGAAPDARRQFRIHTPELQLQLQARQVQLHRDAAAIFYKAVPPVRVPMRLRLGWTLLLTMLRLPGAAALLRKWRGST
jgi:hypothetical protein